MIDMSKRRKRRRYVGLTTDPRHRKYIGKDWDLLGVHQLHTLTQVGMREHHNLLDVGCGSFRGGRFLMMYLNPRNYFGIEPEKWLVKDGIKHEVSQGLFDLKQPTIHYDEDADFSSFGVEFDYILAHSILFHANLAWIKKCFNEVKKVLKLDGMFLANVKFRGIDDTGVEWEYPTDRRYRRETLERIVEDAGLKMELLSIPHLHGSGQKWIKVIHS